MAIEVDPLPEVRRPGPGMIDLADDLLDLADSIDDLDVWDIDETGELVHLNQIPPSPLD